MSSSEIWMSVCLPSHLFENSCTFAFPLSECARKSDFAASPTSPRSDRGADGTYPLGYFLTSVKVRDSIWNGFVNWTVASWVEVDVLTFSIVTMWRSAAPFYWGVCEGCLFFIYLMNCATYLEQNRAGCVNILKSSCVLEWKSTMTHWINIQYILK